MEAFKKALGDDALYKQVIEKLGKDSKIYLQSDLDGSWIPKDVFNKESQKRKDAELVIDELKSQATEQKVEFEKQIKETQDSLKKLEPLAETNEKLKTELQTVRENSEKQISEYSENLKKTQEESERKIAETKFDGRIRDFIRSQGAMKDSQLNAVLANIDRSKVTNDETLTGLGDQVSGLKTTDPNFFGEIVITSDTPPATPPPTGQLSVDQLKNMSVEDIMQDLDAANAAVQN